MLKNCSSDFCDVYSGIAQGSVIEPLLFLLYINDLAEIFDSDVKCKLYADDVKLYSCIDFDPAIQNLLANALDKLIAWSDDWQLSVNINKSNVLHIGKKNYNYEYKINNVNILSSKVIRDLGVEIDDCLKFDVHISCLVKKAYQRLAVLFKGFSSRDSAILTMAYKVSLLLSPHPAKTNFCLHAFQSAASNIWNKLPIDVKSACSMSSFKAHLKTHFFQLTSRLVT